MDLRKHVNPSPRIWLGDVSTIWIKGTSSAFVGSLHAVYDVGSQDIDPLNADSQIHTAKQRLPWYLSFIRGRACAL